MNRAALVGLVALCASAACKSELTPPAVPTMQPPDSGAATVPKFSGAPLTGKWLAAPAAGYTNLTIDVKENSVGQLEGVWTATHGWCGCVLSGRLSVEGAPVLQLPGSYRTGSAVTLFMTVGPGPFVLRNAWGSFSGKMIDSTHISGVLVYSDGSGYFGDDSIGETVVISR